MAQQAPQEPTSQPGITVIRPGATEEDLSDLLADKPEVPITAPRSAPPKVPPKLPSERSMVINRLCRLEYKPGLHWTVLHFLDEPGKAKEMDRYALPNQRLADMEEILAKNPKTVFQISGESFNYKEKPYLIVRLALENHKPLPTSQPAAATTASGAKAATKAVAQEADPDELIRKLLEERPGKPVLGPSEMDVKVADLPSVSPEVAKQLPQAYGTIVADRVVHLVSEQQESWWIVRFVADNTLQEQPIRLLPCALMRWAETLTDTKGGQAIKLRVSGEITRYKGKEYLLLRKVLRERDMNQF